METGSGVKIRKNAKGKTTHIAIDVRKHPEAINALRDAGILPQSSDWEKESADCITPEELVSSVQQLIKTHYASRR